MPSVLKSIEEHAPRTYSRYLALVVFIGVVCFSAAAFSEEDLLQWWEAVAIAGAVVILVLGLVWTCKEVKRLHE